MKAVFEQHSAILETGRLEENLSRAMETSLEEFEALVIDHQKNGEHTGVVRNVKINGAVISHQASDVGESPAPLTNALVNSTEKEQFSFDSGEIRVTAPHAGILVKKLNRDILKTPEEKYRLRFQLNVDKAVRELL